MATKEIQAKEMHTAEVDRISLVKHAATRIPFRVTKEDQSMSKSILDRGIDIANVFKGTKPKAEAPVVVGVAVMKSDKPQTALMAQIEDAGFTASASVDMGDGSQVFPQNGATEFGGTTVLKTENNVALVMKGFSPYSLDMEVENGATFDELCKARGFYPGITSMMEVLREVVLDRARSSTSPADAAKEITSLFAEAGKYAASLVGALPSKAFKLETIDPEDEASTGGDPATGDATNAAAAPAEADPAAVKKGEGDENTDPANDPAQQAAVTGTEAPATPATDAAPAVVNKSDEAPAAAAPAAAPAGVSLPENVLAALATVGDIAKKMDTLTATVEQVSKGLTEQGDSLKDLSGRVVKAEQVAQAADAAVSGTVVLGGAGEAGDRQPAKKQEPVQYGDTDSAYAPRRRAIR